MIKQGDRVRTYDFPWRAENPLAGPGACYAEGVVEEITDPKTHPAFSDCARYRVRVELRMFDGKELTGEKAEKVVFPPLNGTPTWLGNCTNGVELVEKK